MAYTAKHKHARIAPRKARLVMDLIRGRNVEDAIAVLSFSKKRASVMIGKVVKSAVANYNEQETAPSRNSLFVTEARVDAGPVMKRFQPKDRGKSHPIMKRTSHLIVAVEPREDSKSDSKAETEASKD
jgi:large subunit ribosomal protein L22